MCFGIAESVDQQFLTLRNSVIKDSTVFGRMVVPCSIAVVKEIYSWTDNLKMCESLQDFLDMGEALRGEAKTLKEALSVVIELHGQVHNQAEDRAEAADVVSAKLGLRAKETKIYAESLKR